MNTRVLVVDDSRFNVRLLRDILENEGFEVYAADNGLPVIDMTHEIKPDVILLDIIMPGIDGFEVCTRLKGDSEIKDIPVIMITAKTESTDIKKALELGAFDYIKKPMDEGEVIARVQSALRFKQYQDKLKEMAMKDGLTGLYNHGLLMELFEKEFRKNERSRVGTTFAMLDIDHFKKVNDTYGHMAGDMVLRQLSQILQNSVRMMDIIGRYGGEEFGIILRESDEAMAYQISERIRQNVEKYDFSLKESTIHITVSIGICFKKFEDNIEPTEVVRRADLALYQAKTKGRNRVEIFR